MGSFIQLIQQERCSHCLIVTTFKPQKKKNLLILTEERKRGRGENESCRANHVGGAGGRAAERRGLRMSGEQKSERSLPENSRCGELWKNQQVLKRREPAGKEAVLTAERQPSRRL